jgi:2-polyprenyl-3-methyl-5-hydroxy-6-metoxy-1,4-benzoquinol methylase
MALDRSSLESHNAAQRAYYEGRTSTQNRRIEVRSTPYVVNHIERFLAFSNLQAGERVLDVECGMGKYTLPLAERGHELEALDISPRLLEALASAARGRAVVPTHCTDILRPSGDLYGRFDVVAGFFMLHHLADVGEAFGQMRELLKAKGRVVFLDVNPLCRLYYIQIALTPGMSWRAERGILNLTSSKLRAGLAAAGFHNSRIERFGLLPPVLRSRPGAGAVERLFDAVAVLRPVAAFQLISAEL